jgi:hypothetical protein
VLWVEREGCCIGPSGLRRACYPRAWRSLTICFRLRSSALAICDLWILSRYSHDPFELAQGRARGLPVAVDLPIQFPLPGVSVVAARVHRPSSGSCGFRPLVETRPRPAGSRLMSTPASRSRYSGDGPLIALATCSSPAAFALTAALRSRTPRASHSGRIPRREGGSPASAIQKTAGSAREKAGKR